MQSRVVLYHSNVEEKCQKFISDAEYLICSKNSKDDKWLGAGMYFWDNLGNACWWNKKQSGKNVHTSYRIVKANVNLDKLLDLTDYQMYRRLSDLWAGLMRMTELSCDWPLGKKLNYLFTTMGFDKEYSIIKVYGKYNGVKQRKILFEYDIFSSQAEPTMAVKCIYNVKDAKCIIEKEMMEGGEEYE